MIELHNKDCREVMRGMSDNSVDLTVTSPPYDNLRTYNGNNEQWGERCWKGIIGELYRITKPGGVVVWVVGDATINGSETGTSFKQALHAIDCGFNLHDTMIYQKVGLAFPSTNRYHQMFEYMFVFSKGKPKTFNQIRDRKNKSAGRTVTGKDRNADGSFTDRKNKGRVCPEFGARHNIWKIPNQKRGIGHPAVFPESLAHDQLISWSSTGGVVFDPFMGSGTTGVACVNTKRNFIGIELDEGYFEIARQRIAEAGKQQSLFAA